MNSNFIQNDTLEITGEKNKWKILVKEAIKNNQLRGSTCPYYYQDQNQNQNQNEKCYCDHLINHHDLNNIFIVENYNKTKSKTYTYVKMSINNCGTLKNNTRFIRCSPNWPGTYKTLVNLISKDAYYPQLIVSCFGGANHFTMSDKLEKQFTDGIGKVAATKGVWILTTGVNSGVSKLIGQGIHREKLLNNNLSKPTIIGMTSWGKLPNRLQNFIEKQGNMTVMNMGEIFSNHIFYSFDEDNKDNLDEHHTHFILFDIGNQNYLSDEPRSDFVKAISNKHKSIEDKSKCYTVTIIVDGGYNTPETILHDLKAKRPVVIVDGSGRIANLIGMLIKNNKNDINIQNKIKEYIELFPNIISKSDENYKNILDKIINNIQQILQPKYKNYLKLFNLEDNISLTNIIFQAVFHSIDEKERLTNTFELLKLAISWNCLDDAHQILEHQIKDCQDMIPILFKQSLIDHKPEFVDYFLRQHYNPILTESFNLFLKNQNGQTIKICDKEIIDTSREYAQQFIIETLYQQKTNNNILEEIWKIPEDIQSLNEIYIKYIGGYIQSFFYEENTFERFNRDIRRIFLFKNNYLNNLNIIEKYDREEMLRDIFFWSVFMGYNDIAFILLLKMKIRIGPSLIASGIAKRISLLTNKLHLRYQFKKQALKYEIYATQCINQCYKYNQEYSYKILLLPRSLYGNATYMQMSIGNGITQFINTDCFEKSLSEQWNGELINKFNGIIIRRGSFILSIFSLGLIAPLVFKLNNKTLQNDKKENNYLNILKEFHLTPSVKMTYHFLFNTFFLLTFSYMMMFHMKSSEQKIHWTTIYVIITITTMLIESIRIFIIEYINLMLERRHSSDNWKWILHIFPFLLFYIGIIIYFISLNNSSLFSSSRIILSIDLELYYIKSLRFLSALQFFGPKLIMIRKMFGVLLSFLYIIFVFGIGYGVVSSSLTMYNSLQFTVQNITKAILYRPYWFLYGAVDNEIENLDEIIWSNTSTSGEVAEATVQHILLAFHMIFINILILSLLIAVFDSSIGEVESDSKFIWFNQRYKLVREYYEKPMFTYPPISLFSYIGLLIKYIRKEKSLFRILKLTIKDNIDILFTDFENEATYKYARTIVEKYYRKPLRNDQSLNDENEKEDIISTDDFTLEI